MTTLLPDVSGLNGFFGLLSNGPFIQELGKRAAVIIIGVLMVGIGFVTMISASKTGRAVIGTAAKGAAGVATDGASLAVTGV